MQQLEENTIVEVRDGGEVRAALVLSLDERGARVLLPDGREFRVPLERVIHATGERRAAAGAAMALAEWEREAERGAASVDLASLHALMSEEAPGATESLSLADLAGLAVGRDDAASRSAVHRALANANPYFRFNGRTWQALPREDVERELEKRRKAEQLAADRALTLAVAKRRLAGEKDEWPAGAQRFLRPLKDVAIEGEAAGTRREASQVAAEIQGQPPAKSATVTAEAAFDLCVRLGLFPRDENLALLRAGVRTEFAAELLAEAEELARRPIDFEKRLDLRKLEVVTIDDVTTKEVDDGVSIERTSSGFRLGIHISDAAHHVLPGTLVDEEALLRGTSYYVPERTLPMLPAALGEGAASLVQGVDRPTLSFLIEMTPHAEVLGTEVRESVIRVARRMSYEDCEDVLAGRTEEPAWLRDIAPLTAELERARMAAGASPIRAPELSISFDEAGEPVLTLLDPGRPARNLVSELMILANRIAAEFCRARSLPAVYRKQAAADPDTPRPPLDRYDPVAVARFRRSLQRTEVSLEPGPHASLGLPCYVQATSPLRRYQDLAVHREIKASLRSQPLPHSRDEMLVIAAATEQSGRQARQVEGDTDEYWVLRALEHRIGAVLDAVIVRVDNRRTFVELLGFARQFPLAPRPDHEVGKELKLRLRSVKPRSAQAVFEELRA